MKILNQNLFNERMHSHAFRPKQNSEIPRPYFQDPFKSKMNANFWASTLTDQSNLRITVKWFQKVCEIFFAKFAIKSQMLTIYNVFLKSTIEYGLLFYRNTYKTHINEIYKVQRRICRVIYFERKTYI